MDRVLGVFAKEPRPGQVKSRLAATIGPELAAQLYEAFLRDFLARLASLPVSRVLAYWPSNAGRFFSQLVGNLFELEEQTGGNLGARMAAFFQRRFDRGASRVVLVGSDSPDLPLERIELAFAQLGEHDVVLGPSDDGGYYLIGLRSMFHDVFCGIEWGSSEVFSQTLRGIQNLDLEPALLEPWYDIDRPEDLHRLAEHIAAIRRAGCDPGLPLTEKMLCPISGSVL